MQGVVWLDKKLFTSYTTTIPPTPEPGDEEDPDPDTNPTFQISLTSLLETLQIFDSSSPQTRTTHPTDPYTSVTHRDRNHAFSNASLGMSSLCRLSYLSPGSPFSIILEEAGVVTTCSLNTYAFENAADIPFDNSAVKVKIILPSRHLHDAITELSSTSPSTLTLTCSPHTPYFSLSSSGALGSATIDFSKGRDLLETFTVQERWSQKYKFEHVRAAGEAMRIASKVSLRGDEQGVLSLQFMVEVEGGAAFVSFKFVPYLQDDDELGDSEGSDGSEQAEEEG